MSGEQNYTGLVAPSGWVPKGKELFGRGQPRIPVHEGDLVHQNSKTTLVITDLRNLPGYKRFFELTDWIGKEISYVSVITGSDLVFCPGRRSSDSDNVYLIHFKDGTTSEPISETEAILGSFHGDDIDPELLEKIGILSKGSLAERDEEIKFHQSLQSNNKELAQRRKGLQALLPEASRRESHKIYREIEEIEKRLTAIKAELKEERKWHGKVFNYEYLVNFSPLLVDLFGLKTRKHICSGRKVGSMISPMGRVITNIHRLFDSSDCTDYSRDVFALEFADGYFSIPFGLSTGLIMEIPMESLIETKLVSREDALEAELNLENSRRQSASEEGDRRRLNELRKELEKFGLGEKRTCQVLQEIALLEQSS